jgi:sporulation protein YlmC with PRC-barrel domain
MKPIATFLIVVSLAALPILPALAQQQAPPPAQTPTAQPPATQGQVLVGSDSLVGSSVRNSEGRDVGKVSRLMIDPNDGRVASVVVAMGGTLGVGSNTIAVPWNSVKIGQDRGKLIITTSSTLDNAPAPASQQGSGQQPRQQ